MMTARTFNIFLLCLLIIPTLTPAASAEQFSYSVPENINPARDITLTISGNSVHYQSTLLYTWDFAARRIPGSKVYHDYTFELTDVMKETCNRRMRNGSERVVNFKLRNGPLLPGTYRSYPISQQMPDEWWDISVDSESRQDEIFELICNQSSAGQNNRAAPRTVPQAVHATCPDGSPIPATGVCPTLVYPSKAELEAQERAKQEEARRAAEEERQRQEAARRAAEEERRRKEIAMQEQFQKLQEAAASRANGALNIPAPAIKAVSDDIDEDVLSDRPIGDWARDRRSPSWPATRTYVSVILRSLWNAVPIVGTFIWGSENVEETGRMLEAMRREVNR